MDYLHYKGYRGSVEYSMADNCLFGKVLDLKNSLILYEGCSLNELREDFESALENYIESCHEDGIQPEMPHTTFNVRIPSEVHSRIAIYAQNSGTSIDAFVRDSIEKRLETV